MDTCWINQLYIDKIYVYYSKVQLYSVTVELYRLNILYTQAGGNGDTCWRKQCSRCKEFYIGDPVDGHQE